MVRLHHRHHKRQLPDILSEARSVVNSLQNGGESSNDFSPATAQQSTTFESTVFQTVSGDFTQPTVGFSTLNPQPTPDSSQQPQATQVQSSPQQFSSPQQQSTSFAQQTSQQAKNTPSPSTNKQSSQQPSQPPSQQPSPTPSTQANTRTSIIQVIPNASSSSSSSSAAFAAPSSMTSSASSVPLSILTAASAAVTSSISSIAAPTGGNVSQTAAAAAATTSSSSSPVKKGMSGGAKAGLAIGILAIIGLVAGGILFFYAKKKRQNEDYERAENEKFNATAAKPRDMALSEGEKSPANAPRLSLRPVTQFLPDLGAAKKRLSNGNFGPAKPNGMGTAGSPRSLTRPNPGGSAWERRAVPVSSSGDDPNPFSDPVNPFSDKNASAPGTPTISITPPSTSNGTDASASALAGAAISGAVGATALSRTGDRGSPPPKDIPAAPMGDTRSVSSGASPPPAGPAVSKQGEDNVHRVQMDFAPSMDDELELRAGQLIKILHEYDDGWALCVRLDRSQQGVCPRTCLSAKPLKPRGRGPRRPSLNGAPTTPPGAGPQNGPRQGPNRAPTASPVSGLGNDPRGSSPTTPPPSGPLPQPRPMSPAPYNQPPRPLSPGPQKPRIPANQKRSMSPGPYGGGPAGVKPPPSVGQRRRSNSASAMSVRDKRNSPPGPSPLANGQSYQPLPPPGTAS